MRMRMPRARAWILIALLSLLSTAMVWAQQEPSEEAQPNEVPTHWSPYQAPSQYPEGAQLHIIVRGDTLWDLANRYLTNPFLWPQLWESNRYITNPHRIYPGDPVVIPQLDVLRAAEEEPGALPAAGEPGAPGTAPSGVPGAPGVPGLPGTAGPSLYPLSEETTIQCADYITEIVDESMWIIGSEEKDRQIALSDGDIVYINKGSQDGIFPGDRYYTHRRLDKVTHPLNREILGWHITRTGWLVILAAQEQTAIAEIVQPCIEIFVGDYLLPFEPVPVPLLPAQEPAHRLTPETGRTRGHIIVSLGGHLTLGQGLLVSVDLGEENGIIPGNVFTIFRYLYPGVQRKMLGELAILTVQERTSTAKIINSYDIIDIGDEIEMK